MKSLHLFPRIFVPAICLLAAFVMLQASGGGSTGKKNAPGSGATPGGAVRASSDQATAPAWQEHLATQENTIMHPSTSPLVTTAAAASAATASSVSASAAASSAATATSAAAASVPAAAADSTPSAAASGEVAVFGAGCFWCVEPAFEMREGVLAVESGYMGGTVPNPTYEQICRGDTGHAEVVKVTFDPQVISYAELVDWFFLLHDPTTLNRQGADVGTQYRSVIFTYGEQQQAQAQAGKARAAELYADPVVTFVEPAQAYYPAEDYHQDYFRNNPAQSYCRIVIAPKLRKLQQLDPQ